MSTMPPRLPIERKPIPFQQFVTGAPEVLGETQGASWLPGFISTQVDRSIYGATEGGAGRWAFGYLRTPQRWLIDTLQGWDPDVADKPDPNWNAEEASKLIGGITDSQRAAIMVSGGQDLMDEIVNNSVSQAHFVQRINEIEVVANARMAIEKYDQDLFLTMPGHKVFSAVVNYVASDPTTIATIAATGYLATAKAATAATGVAQAASTATRVASMTSRVSNTTRAATYTWDALDGASSAFSSLDQLNRDGVRVYSDLYTPDDSYATQTAFGAGLGLVFSAGADGIGAMLRRGAKTPGPSTLENVHAQSKAGHLHTDADITSMSVFRHHKSRLEKALDYAEQGPDSTLRRQLMDDDARADLGWGSTADVADLADWVEKNRPNAEELAAHVNARSEAAALNRKAVEEWGDEVSRHVEAGGDERNFFRKKSFDFLRNMMGDDFAKYRFIVDWLEEATGDSRLVAEFIARGDKERILRAANAVNSTQRVVASEARAFDSAMARIKEVAQEAERDVAEQAVNRIRDNITQGRFRGAVDILNEMHVEVQERHGKILARVDASINSLNSAWTSMNRTARRRFSHYERLLNLLSEYRSELALVTDALNKNRAGLRNIMANDASASDVMIEADYAGASIPPSGVSSRLDNIKAKLLKAKAEFESADARVEKTIEKVDKKQSILSRRYGQNVLTKVMETIEDFPKWKAELAEAGYSATRRAAVRQTKAANRWKVQFVDRFLGDSAADNALTSGTNPMRPVMTERAPMRALTPEEQDRVLAEEMAKAAPEIASIRAKAKDVTLDDKIGIAGQQIARLTQSIEQAKSMFERSRSRKLKDFIDRREKLLKRMTNLQKRLQNQLDGQIEELNKDLVPTEVITPESLEAARRSARKVAHDKSAKKLSVLPADRMATAEGRKLRNKVRRLAAEVEGGTEYNVLGRESQALDLELEAAKARVVDLESRGSLDGDPDLIAARKEVKYLEKKSADVKSRITAIEGRPAAMKRSHALQGDKPEVKDVVELTRLRVALKKAIDENNELRAEELNREIYSKFGDTIALPRWKDLEDLMSRLDAEAENPTRDVITDIKMDGREAVVTIRRGENLPMSVVTAEKPIKPAGAMGKERDRLADETEAARFEKAIETTTEVAEPKIEELRFTASTPITEATVAKKTTSTGSAAGKVDPKEPSKSEKILAKLAIEGKPGERILITSAAMNAMGRVPLLRGLGRALFRFQTIGTRFGEIHSASRSLDLIVSAFNMLDRPEALQGSLGFKAGVHRTLQNFKDQGRIAVNEVAVAYQKAVRAGHWTPESDLNVQKALDAGSAEGLNAGEAEVFRIIQGHYKRTGDRLNVSRPGTSLENYRAREGNAHAIMRNKQGAQDSFAEVYFERMTSGQPLDDELCDKLGIARKTTWNALSPTQQAAFESAVRERARFMASQTINRLSNGIVEEGIGYRLAAQGASSRYARTLEDAVANDARVRQWYIQSPIEEFKRYMEVRAPQIMFDAQITDMIGEPATFDEVIDAIGNQFANLTDEAVKTEAAKVIDHLRQKWNYHTGRAQYNPDNLLDASIRASTGIVRGAMGPFWGLAGLTTEIPRAVAASKMYGGSMRGIIDAIDYVRRSGDLGLVQDIAHATDQYSTMAHSSFGTSVGTSTWERFVAPWERAYRVFRNQEAVTTGGQDMGRGLGTAVSLAEAYGETGMRLGGMQYFSGLARFIADSQAKRFLSRNVDKMANLAERLKAIGAVADQSPESIARFRQACSEAGIPYDVALRLNHNGLLDPDVVSKLKDALTGLPERFDLASIRGRMDDRSFGAVMDFLTEAHNFHVPTSSLATAVESRSAIDKMFYNLTSFARAFSLNVAFRTAANGRLATMMSTFAAVAIGENIYQMTRDVAMGRTSTDDLAAEWEEDPTKFFLKRAVKTPWLGAQNSLAMSAIEYATTGSATSQLRGNNLVGPMVDLLGRTSKAVFADDITGERDMSVIQTYTPVLNTWYSRLMLGPLEK